MLLDRVAEIRSDLLDLAGLLHAVGPARRELDRGPALEVDREVEAAQDHREQADQDDGDKEGSQVEEVGSHGILVFMSGQGKDDRDRTCAGGHREGDRVKEEVVDIACFADGLGGLIFSFYAVVGVKQGPAHSTDHDTTGQLYDGDGDAKDPQDPAANECSDSADSKAVEGDFFGCALAFFQVQVAENGVYDKGRSDWIDGREEGKKTKNDQMQKR